MRETYMYSLALVYQLHVSTNNITPASGPKCWCHVVSTFKF